MVEEWQNLKLVLLYLYNPIRKFILKGATILFGVIMRTTQKILIVTKKLIAINASTYLPPQYSFVATTYELLLK